MNVSLTPQLEKFIERELKQGLYQTSSEVVRAALRLLQEQSERRRLEIERLKKEIQLGVEQLDAGLGSELDLKEVKAEGRKRLAERRLKRVG